MTTLTPPTLLPVAQWGLTASEARTLDALITWGLPEAVAEALGLSKKTVEVQLQGCRNKAGGEPYSPTLLVALAWDRAKRDAAGESSAGGAKPLPPQDIRDALRRAAAAHDIAQIDALTLAAHQLGTARAPGDDSRFQSRAEAGHAR